MFGVYFAFALVCAVSIKSFRLPVSFAEVSVNNSAYILTVVLTLQCRANVTCLMSYPLLRAYVTAILRKL